MTRKIEFWEKNRKFMNWNYTVDRLEMIPN